MSIVRKVRKAVNNPVDDIEQPSHIAEVAGVSYNSVVKLQTGDDNEIAGMRLGNIEAVLEAVGYKLVVKPKWKS